MLGLLLTVGAVMAGTFMDHSLLTAADVRDKLNTKVLGVIPEGEERGLLHRGPAQPKPKKVQQPKELRTKQPEVRQARQTAVADTTRGGSAAA